MSSICSKHRYARTRGVAVFSCRQDGRPDVPDWIPPIAAAGSITATILGSRILTRLSTYPYPLHALNRLETHMAAFDDALAALAAKVDALIAHYAGDTEALAEANARAAAAEALAAKVVADDAAEDAAQDQARADALAGVNTKIDAILNPAAPEPETPAEAPEPGVEAPADETPVDDTPADVPADEPVDPTI